MTAGHAVVIGGGPSGVKAAHELIKTGARVTLLETAPILGGLASVFDVQGVRIERYYHFICKGDDHLVETLDELGLSHKLHWRDSRMAYFVDGRLYPFLTPDVEWLTPQRTLHGVDEVRNQATWPWLSPRHGLELDLDEETTDLGGGRTVSDVHEVYREKSTGDVAYTRDHRIELTVRDSQIAKYELRFAG